MSDFQTTLISFSGACPKCGKNLNACTYAEGEYAPSPGDPSVCWYCAEILVFAEAQGGLILRLPTPAELIDLQISEAWPLLERVARGIAKNREERP